VRHIVLVTFTVLVTLTTTPIDAADYVAMSGQQLYARFCASCHGLEGHGDGPVAQSFASKVPDLTLIVRRHGGEFPRDWVERTIDGRQRIGAHGAYTMPVWGEDFSRTDIGSPDAERTARTIIAKLVDYLEALQQGTERKQDADQD
jgi:mono/diheme cytochrome c family protein